MHLLKVEAKGLFSAQGGTRTSDETAEKEAGRSFAMPKLDPNESVHVTTTPAEAARLQASNYPRYDAMDVVNLPSRTRGKHY